MVPANKEVSKKQRPIASRLFAVVSRKSVVAEKGTSVELKESESGPSLQRQLAEAIWRGAGLSIVEVEGPRRLGEILVDEGLVGPEKVRLLIQKQRRLGQLLVDEGDIGPEELDRALRRQTEEVGTLIHSIEHLGHLIQEAADVLLVLNPNATIRSVNGATLRLMGYDEQELVGEPAGKFFTNGLPANGRLFEEVAQGKAVRNVELACLTKAGQAVAVLMTCSPLRDSAHKVRGATCVGTDISRRKHAEDALSAYTRQMEHHNDQIRKIQEKLIEAERLASLGMLAAEVSHEILNPLNVIAMRLYMLRKDSSVSPEVARHLETLDEQTQRAARISQDLLDFSRQRDAEAEPLDLTHFVAQTLGLIEQELALRGIEVRSDLASDLPPVVVDAGRLQQVVLNLLTNARDAMPDGGELTLATREALGKGRRWVELRIEDSGAGIPPDDIERLFEPFYSTKAAGLGTGLGLYVCHCIVRSHGGRLWAENRPEGGAALVVRLAAEA